MAELNLLPYKLKQRRLKKEAQKKYIFTIVPVAVILVVIFLIPLLIEAGMEKRDNDLIEQIRAKNSIVLKNNKLTNQINDIDNYIKKVNTMTTKKHMVKDDLSSLNNYIPKDIQITNLSYMDNKINLSGTTANYSSISAFVANLQQSDMYTSTTISGINNNGGKFDFNMTITISAQTSTSP